MKTLNLANLEKSDIKYKISQFPDGQQQVKIINTIYDYSLESGNFLKKDIVQIKSRLNNFKDLELIICTVASLKELGVKNIELYTPYFLGSRSDRKFEEGSNNYLKTVICPIINSLGFAKVTVLDPHSDILEACLNNFSKESNTKLITYSLGKIYKNLDLNQFILISPDAGANKKIFKVAEEIGYKGDIITCSKSRDVDGKLIKTFVPLNATLLDKDFIIIDDICDGGATFINIAKEIKKWDTTNSCKIYLVVTHGIFSNGYTELLKYFDAIYTTNSIKNIGELDGNTNKRIPVHQLNVI